MNRDRLRRDVTPMVDAFRDQLQAILGVSVSIPEALRIGQAATDCMERITDLLEFNEIVYDR